MYVCNSAGKLANATSRTRAHNATPCPTSRRTSHQKNGKYRIVPVTTPGENVTSATLATKW